MSDQNTASKDRPIWALGFRPFFIVGSVFAFIDMMLWLLFLSGYISIVNPIVWHGHEMIFGFVGAIIIGFLLTASQNWSGTPGVSGNKLKQLTLIWLLARGFSFFPWLLAFTVSDLLFFPLCIYALLPYLSLEKQKKNRIFLYLLALLTLANLMTHLQFLNIQPLASQGFQLAIDLILIMIILLAGRVLPFFTSRVVNDYPRYKFKLLEGAVFISSGLFFLGEFVFENNTLLAILALAAAAFHLTRWCLWLPWRSIQTPILTILYVGYLWVILGFVLKGLTFFAGVPSSLALHAWTVGAMGVMIYGMVTRVTLGHTGRKIQASKSVVLGYLIVNLAVILRVILPLVFPAHSLILLTFAGLFWIGAFFILLINIVPVLIQARPDGKVG